MLRNYIITAFRSFKNNKTYTLINILGLSLGIACCFIQFAIIRHELSFDQFHQSGKKIYRIVEHETGNNGVDYGAWLPNPMGHTLDEELPGVDVIPLQGPLGGVVKIQTGDEVKLFREEENILFANANLLNYFSFPIIRGGNPSVLNEFGKVILTESIAEKYFGTENPIGKYINYADISMEVAGVVKDVPYSSTLRFDIIASYPTIRKIYPDWISSWGAYWQGTSYVVVNDPANVKSVESQINSVVAPHLENDEGETIEYFLQPLADIHSNATYANGPNYILPKEALLASGLTVLMILIVSVFNFVNLSTSQAIKRSKEIGIRKTLGSRKINLINQFLIETLFIVSIASFLALTLSQIFMNWLNETISDLPIRLAFDNSVVLLAIGIIVVVTLLAGIYPASILARFNPVQAIRNQATLSSSGGSFSLRKVLIVAQFTVANLLVAVTIIASAQMTFIKKKDLGFDASNIIILNFSDKTSASQETIKHDFASLNFVERATWCMGPPQTGWSWSSAYNLVGEPSNDALFTNLRFVDADYLSTFSIPLMAGRNIESIEFPDSAQQVLVNEEFVRRLGLSPEEAVGRRVSYNGSFEGIIEGVVKNFHVNKLQQAIPPAMLAYQPGQMNAMALKVANEDINGYRDELQTKYREYDKEGVFDPLLLSNEIAKTYFVEDLAFNSFRLFSLLAIVISLMGLYGLVNFMIAKNRKNISIKKIFGASSKILLAGMSKEYLLLLSIAFIVSTPLCILVMNNWLNDFYYHIEISWMHFLISFFTIVAVAALTVAYKSYQVAVENPVDALRSE
jgi:putative ABC transport system permease protein